MTPTAETEINCPKKKKKLHQKGKKKKKGNETSIYWLR